VSGAGAAPHRAGLVALVGWTNVGKSTLFNRLVGCRIAAVADVAQTTRHRITGVVQLGRRGQIALVDTPGLHEPRDRLNRRMLELVRGSLGGVDAVLWVVDAARGIGAGDRQAATLALAAGAPCLAVLNKLDRVASRPLLLPMMQLAAELGCAAAVPVSATTGEGADALVQALLEQLPEAPALYDEDYLTDQSERGLVAEWIREELVRETRQELPHSIAVVVERWVEREGAVLRIEATVLIERESQKPIVIGKDGERLKRVGIAARAAAERLLDRPVFLGLWVRVRQDWRNDDQTLAELGLG